MNRFLPCSDIYNILDLNKFVSLGELLGQASSSIHTAVSNQGHGMFPSTIEMMLLWALGQSKNQLSNLTVISKKPPNGLMRELMTTGRRLGVGNVQARKGIWQRRFPSNRASGTLFKSRNSNGRLGARKESHFQSRNCRSSRKIKLATNYSQWYLSSNLSKPRS